MRIIARRFARAALCAVAAAMALTSGAVYADDDSCKEWRKEHCRWKIEAMRRYLHGAPQRELDEAIFEALQRETYLTSCDVTVQVARTDLLGWRLVDRLPDDFGRAVVESVLESGGFEPELRERFVDPPPSASFSAGRSVGRRYGVRGRGPY